MRKTYNNNYYYEHAYIYAQENNNMNARKRYGVMAFIFDVFMIGLTGGFWLVWIYCREKRGEPRGA